MNARLAFDSLSRASAEGSALEELRLRALMLSLTVAQAQSLSPTRGRYWPSEIYSSLAKNWSGRTNEGGLSLGGLDALLNELRGLGPEVRAPRLARLIFDVLDSMPMIDHVLTARLIREVDLMVYREFAAHTP